MSNGQHILKTKTLQSLRGTTVLLLFTFLFFFSVTDVVAAEIRQQNAHLHGVGKLNFALDGNDLIIELTSPAVNIVGFEYAPQDEQQSHEVQEAIDLLKEGEKLFVLTPKAECSLNKAYVKSDMGPDSHEGALSEENHDGESAHSEFEVLYHFWCDNPDSLKAIDVMLFSFFPRFEELEIQMVTSNGQTAVELTPKKFQLTL